MQLTDMQRALWAHKAVQRAPVPVDSDGLSYGEASKRCLAICAAAVERGSAMNVAAHLLHLEAQMRVTLGHREPAQTRRLTFFERFRLRIQRVD